MQNKSLALQIAQNDTAEAVYTDRQKSHCHCIACGNANPASLKLRFDRNLDGSVEGMFKGKALLQGYPGMLHGGIISSLLDAAMTHCLFHHDIEAVTGELVVRFLHPVPCNAQLHISARLLESRGALHRLASELHHNNQKLAKATASFMTPVI